MSILTTEIDLRLPLLEIIFGQMILKMKWNVFNWTQVHRQDHRYLIEEDCSLGQFRSAKLKDKQYTINAPIFSQHCKKRKRLMHQLFNIFIIQYQFLT